MPSVAKRIVLLLAAISAAVLGMYLLARGIGNGSIVMQVGGGVALVVVAMACLYFAAVEPWENRG